VLEHQDAGVDDYNVPAHCDTVYLTVVDRDLNMVSFINSIFDDFGSGITARQSGVLLHNRGSGFVVERGHPNTIEGRKRPLHTIIPALLTHKQRPVLALGVTGGHFQPLGQTQLLNNLILGHAFVHAENPIGTAQAIRIDWENGVLHGAADGRRDGLALGH
jgi:gamma-glutamyltranspeptidase/glutathione hydrolase